MNKEELKFIKIEDEEDQEKVDNDNSKIKDNEAIKANTEGEIINQETNLKIASKAEKSESLIDEYEASLKNKAESQEANNEDKKDAISMSNETNNLPKINNKNSEYSNSISEGKINQNKFLENINLDNSFERLEKTKLDEIDDLFSPFDIKNSNNKNLNFSQQGFNLNLTQCNSNLQDGKVSAFKLQEKEKDSNSNNNNVF